MVQRLAAVLLLAAAAACGAAAPAAAAPCTNTYIGPHWGGASEDPGNWSRHVLPGPADHVCFPAGFRVDVGGGVHAFRSISGVRTLVITGGSLLLTDPKVATTVTNLVIYADGVCSP